MLNVLGPQCSHRIPSATRLECGVGPTTAPRCSAAVPLPLAVVSIDAQEERERDVGRGYGNSVGVDSEERWREGGTRRKKGKEGGREGGRGRE